MRKDVICFLILSVCCLSTHSENIYTPTVPPSPDAASLGKYGQFPVSMCYGVVQIEVPFHTIQLPSVVLPISLSYHASGIRVNDISTTSGLGWTLNAGGVVTRSVRGIPDNNFGTPGTIFNKQWVTNLSEGDRFDYLSRIYTQEVSEVYDSESDIYYYNVNGLTGSFRLDINQNVIQIPLTNNRIEFDSGGNFFKITDSNGNLYTFSSKEESFTKAGGGGKYTSSWYLTAINTPDRREIGFDYLTDQTVYVDRYASYSLSVPQDNMALYNLAPTMSFAGTSLTLHPKKITFPEGTITFSYDDTRADRRKYRLTGMEVKNNLGQRLKSFSLEHGYFTSSRSISYGEASRSTHYDANIGYRLKLNKLHQYDGDGSKVGEYVFDYNTPFLPDYLGTESLTPYASGTKQYYFGQDLWGYYNGVTTNRNFFTYRDYIQSYQLMEAKANRAVNYNYAKASSLSKITYPTGGSSEFNYESNEYGLNEKAGGLRIQSIKSYPGGGAPPVTRTFQYGEGARNIVGWIQQLGSCYTQILVASSYRDIKYHDIYTSESSVPLSYNGGASAYYMLVTEFAGDLQTNSGKTEYAYISASSDIQYQNLYPCYNPSLPPTVYRFIPKFDYTHVDRGSTRGYLTSQKMFVNNGGTYSLVKQLNYSYTTYKFQKNVVGFKAFPNYIPPSPSMSDIIHTFLANEVFQYTDITAETQLMRLTKEEERTYANGVEKVKTTGYFYDRLDNQYEMTAMHQVNSDGNVSKRSFKYPRDINTGGYSEMVYKNILSPVVVTTDSLNNHFVSEKQTFYEYQYGLYIVPTHITERTGSGNSESRVAFLGYDAKANLNFMTEDGEKKTVYLWGYNYRYLIAKIENATFNEVAQSITGGVSTIVDLAVSNAPNVAAVDALRQALPQAMVTTYTYKPLWGITSITDPSGVITIYEYDSYGRPISSKDHQGKELKHFRYHTVSGY